MRRAITVLLLLTLAGCGGGAPSEVVPADAKIYLSADASQAERTIGWPDGDFDFDRDVRPWLGERVAYFTLGAPDAGFVIDSEDDEAAEAFARKVTTGSQYRASAVIDGHLVLTSSRELLRAANAAAGGQALADSTRLDVEGEDSDDPPAFLITSEEPRTVHAAFELLLGLDRDSIPVEALGDGPLTARLWDRRIEVAGLPPHSDTAPTLANVPGAAWLAVASADLGEDVLIAREHEQYEQIEAMTGLDLERSVLPHLGAGMFFVQGRTPADMGGRLVAEVADEEALRRAIASARRTEIPYRARISDGRLYLDVGVAPGGVAEDLDDTRAYKDAERRLGGAPTFLLIEGDGYLAARDAVEDGRRVVSVEQRR